LDTLHLFSVFAASFAAAILIKLTHSIHGRWTGDFADSGVQKHHEGNPPRVGLLPLLAGSGVGVLGLQQSQLIDANDAGALLALLLLCAAPAAALGLLEDVTKKVRARWRLLAPMIGVCLGAAVMGALIPTLGIPGLNLLVQWWPVALLVTILMVVGFTHAMNIVDGLNGLASGLALMMLGATAYAAHHVGDQALFQVCGVLAVAVLGFLAINFPRGLMFLGDGGAYFLGFVLAQIWVLLLVRNPGEVSPWFVMAVAFHPTMETIYSILRRKFLRARRRNATAPDRLHLHTLVFRRRVRPLLKQWPWAEAWVANAGASLGVLFFAAVPILAACLRPDSHLWGIFILLVAIVIFLAQFRDMAQFRGFALLRWVKQSRRHSRAPVLGQASAFDGQ
jgi:UDP-GlcNAc:undecaprenyl-phosphate/decaprenyl-phosphate GlcNAc-1-phosphate transferase